MIKYKIRFLVEADEIPIPFINGNEVISTFLNKQVCQYRIVNKKMKINNFPFIPGDEVVICIQSDEVKCIELYLKSEE